MIRLGLTGSIGAGKSTVADLLRQRNIPVLDADVAARSATADPMVLKAVRAEFGPDVMPGGALDRRRLAALVFHDPQSRAALNAIIHPWVRRDLARQEAALRDAGAEVVVQDIPLLFESGLEGTFDAVLNVDAPFELRASRLRNRSGMSLDEARARDAAQMNSETKNARATVVLRNDGTLEDLERQLDAALERLVCV